MRYCQDCINYNSCERQGTDIPDQIVEQQGRDVIHLLCHDFVDGQPREHREWAGGSD